MAEDKYEVSKEEYGELLAYKKEKILRKAQEDAKKIDEELAKLFSRKPVTLFHGAEASGESSINPETPWKVILEHVFNTYGPELTTSEIIKHAISLPIGQEKINAAPKSISSNLSSNLNTRYKLVERDNKRYYCLLKN